MIKLTQRFPNFFSGFTPQKYDFNSFEELNKFIENPPKESFLCNWNTSKDFVKFEIRKTLLMVILKESFWAIAYIKEIS